MGCNCSGSDYLCQVLDTGVSFATPALAQTLSVTLNGSYNDHGFCPGSPGQVWFSAGPAASPSDTTHVQDNNNPDTFSAVVTMFADSNNTRQPFRRSDCDGHTCGTGYSFFFTSAMVASASAPTSSAITSSSATIACNFFPNTNESTATSKLQYRKFGDTTWIDAGSTQANSGYSQQSISRNLTGLLSSTVYEFRLSMTRTTVNDTSLISSVSTFTTTAGVPIATTVAASSVAARSAVLNGSLAINQGTGVNVYFKWDTANPPVANQTANQPESADGTFLQSLSGLLPSTTYFFQAFASFSSPSGSPSSGSVLSFTTPADPLAAAAQEAHMNMPQYDGMVGVQSTFPLTLVSPAATSSDRLISAAVASIPIVAADCLISKDGGAFVQTTNLPVQITAAVPGYQITLTVAEMSATAWIVVLLVDADGPAFRDVAIFIRVQQNLGQINVSAVGYGTNQSAFNLTGNGTSPALNAIGGATSRSDIAGAIGGHILRRGTAQAGAASNVTLDAAASGTTDYYTGCLITLISGTGTDQQRVIIGYNGATKVATVDSPWATNPAAGTGFVISPADRPWNLSPVAELASIPSPTDTYGNKVQALFQRFFFKRTQTSGVQTLLKSDSTTTLGTASVSDDGTTQSSGKLA